MSEEDGENGGEQENRSEHTRIQHAKRILFQATSSMAQV
jgi:hypothetical protein